MKNSLFISILLLLTQIQVFAQNNSTQNYSREIFTNATGNSLNYRMLTPLIDFKDCAEGTKKYPLVLFLHGAGERGNDNEKQLIHGSKLFSDIETRQAHPAFVIFPQCPENKRWVEVDWNLTSHVMPTEASVNMQLVLDLIDDMQKRYPIDTNRIYVVGLSMGGFGTWDIISRYPEKFAAAVPICGGGDEAQAPKLNKIPIWAFHGGNDKLVLTDRSRNMINAIKTAGGAPRYTEYPGVGHLSWNKAFAEPDFLNWIFSNTLQNK